MPPILRPNPSSLNPKRKQKSAHTKLSISHRAPRRVTLPVLSTRKPLSAYIITTHRRPTTHNPRYVIDRTPSPPKGGNHHSLTPDVISVPTPPRPLLSSLPGVLFPCTAHTHFTVVPQTTRLCWWDPFSWYFRTVPRLI